jgi:hypothetical protein
VPHAGKPAVDDRLAVGRSDGVGSGAGAALLAVRGALLGALG